MESLNDLRKAIDGIIATQDSKLNILKQVKLLLNSDELNVSDFSLNGAFQSNPLRNTVTDNNYPKRGSMREKVEYVLSKKGRAVQSVELIALVDSNEIHSITKKQIGSFSGTLNSLIKKGLIVGFKYNNDKKLAFYAKPDWVGHDGTYRIIKPEHCPSAEILASIPEDKLKPELITWNDSSNHN